MSLKNDNLLINKHIELSRLKNELEKIQKQIDALEKDDVETYLSISSTNDLLNEYNLLSNKELHTVIEQSPAAIALLTVPDYKYVLANSTYQQFFNRNLEELINNDIRKVFPKLEEQGYFKTFEEAYLGGKAVEISEFPKPSQKNNEATFFDFTIQPIITDGVNISHILVHAVEVTDKITHQRKIKESELYFKTLTDAVPAIIWITEPDGYCSYLNKRWYDYTGQTEEEGEGYGWLKAIHPDDFDASGEAFKIANSQQKDFFIHYRLWHKNGYYRWAIDHGSPRFDDGGNYLGMIGTVIDIHEQKLADESLVFRQALLEAHNQASLDGILLVDPEGKILSFNKRFVEIWNMPPEIIAAHDDTKALAFAMTQLKNPEEYIGKVKALYESHERDVDELLFLDGKIIERHGYPIIGTDGNYYAWSWIFRDVTRQKNNEAAVKESEERYSNMINSSPASIAILKGEDFILTIANDTILKQLGRGREIIGKPYLQSIPELEENGLGNILKEVYKTGISYHAYEMPVELLHGDRKKLMYFNFSYEAQKNIKGEINGIAIIANEVTLQAEYHKKIRESELNFRQLAELLPTKVTNADINGNVIYYNKSWLDYTGLSFDELKDWGIEKVFHPDEAENIRAQWKSCLKSGKDFEREIRILNKYGEYKWHLSIGTPLKDDDGKIIKWVGTNTEIQKIKEEEQRKLDFIKIASHELKTPLTSIKGYTQLLLKVLEKQNDIKIANLPLKPSLLRIDSQIVRLSKLINELLDVSRIQESKLELNLETFNLNALIEDTVQDLKYSNTEYNISVTAQELFNVFADKDRIGQVLINFVTNAIKYSPGKNRVDILINQTEKNCVGVSVKDYGIGIDEKDQHRIFERFYRVDGNNEKTYQGFGIGLFIVKDIILRHQGTINVESKKGEGSVFTFTLPISI